MLKNHRRRARIHRDSLGDGDGSGGSVTRLNYFERVARALSLVTERIEHAACIRRARVCTSYV